MTGPRQPDVEIRKTQPRASQVAKRANLAVSRQPLKWVGGKARLLPALLTHVPERFGRYHEPFAGGAALFFALRPARAVLSDANPDLIACYQALARDPEVVIAEVECHRKLHGEGHFRVVRDEWNAGAGHDAERAAAFLYLNRAGFNGLWRVNRAGEFNVGWGKHTRAALPSPDQLRAAASALARTELRCCDYREAVADAQAGDLVYLDSPYDGTFTGYTAEAFGPEQQAELAAVAGDLAARGVHVIASNADTPRVRELYAGWALEVVHRQGTINSDGAKRAPVAELIITRGEHMGQTYIAGTEPPGRNQVIEDAIAQWAAEREKQRAVVRRAAERTAAKHAALLEAMTSQGVERYAYTDAAGRKRVLELAEVKRARSVAAKGRAA